MNELTIFNRDVIPVYTTDKGEQVVVGRELHEALSINRDYSNWFKQMCGYGFEERKDYSPFLANRSDGKAGKPRTEHLLKLDMAKHIAMIQRTEQGKAIRQKLIELENQVSARDSYMIANPVERAKRWIEEEQERENLRLENAALATKARFTDAVSASDGSILVGDLAKILNRNGINVGGTRLFNWFRENGWLCKQRGNLWNKPTQKAVERGFFEYTETVVKTPNHSKINITPKVTGKGQTYFVDLFLSGKAVIG